MVAFNERELVGNLIPNAYISKITLQSSGDVIGEPNPYVQTTSSFAIQSTGSLRSVIELVVKEKPSENLNFTWFDNIDLKKYIKIQLIQSRDQETTEFLTNGIDAIRYCLEPSLLTEQENRDIENIAKTIYKTQNPRQTIDSKLDSDEDIQNIYLNDSLNININKKVFFEDAEGKKTYDIKYTKTYTNLATEPEHLAYFLYTTFDIEQLSRDFNIQGNASNTFKNIYGKISSDIVIEEYDIVSKTFYFVDQENKIWLGDVEQDINGNWVSQEDNTIKLTIKEDVNDKVQDFRNFQKIKKNLNYNLTNQNIFFQKNPIKILGNKTIIDAKKEKYFSNLKISHNFNGNPYLIFSFNYEKCISRESKYAKMLKESQKFKEQYLTKLAIKSLKIYRQQVNSLNDLKILEDSKIIAESHDVDSSLVKKQEELYSMEELQIFTENTNNKIRTFIVHDKNFTNNKGGNYQYSIEIKIEDTFDNFIREKIKSLLKNKVELEKYYEISSIPKITRRDIEKKEPHTNGEKIRIISEVGGHFDQENNQFTQEFQIYINNKYGNDLKSRPYYVAINEYLDVLEIFSSITQQEKQNYRQFMQNICSPETGNPEGILTFISMMDNLINTLAKMSSTDLATQSKVNGVNSAVSRIIDVKNTFNEIFDSNVDRDHGFDYLFFEKNENMFINSGTLIDRITLESRSYGNISEVHITPSRVDKINQSYLLLNYSSGNGVKIWENNPYLFLSYIKNNIIVNTSLENQISKINEINEQHYDGYQMQNEQLEEYNLYKNMKNSVANKFALIVENASISSNEQNLDPYKSTSVNKSNINNILNSLLFSVNTNKNFVFSRKQFTDLILKLETQKKDKLPTQIKWLSTKESLYTSSEDISDATKKDIEYFYITNMLKGIQYLDSIEKSEDMSENITSENWRILTVEKIAQLQSNKQILCKLVTFRDNSISINFEKEPKYRFYNEYFIIKT